MTGLNIISCMSEQASTNERYALLSVWDKTGIVDFAKGLTKHGFKLLSTGGTARALRDAGLVVLEVSEMAHFPEVFGGRVKTLQPEIFGSILFRRGVDDEEAREMGLLNIELVCVNLYPFEKTAESGAKLRELVEMIDIGGPSLIRAAAKNHESVVVVTNPDDYQWVLDRIAKGGVCPRGKRHLALKAFAATAAYDVAIYQELHSRFKKKQEFPFHFFAHLEKAQDLRYGENPHQAAAYYGSAPWQQLWGKELSYNNIQDATAAWEMLSEFSEPAAVVVKHLIPCGVAIRKDVFSAFKAAHAADPVSAFGGIIAVNRPVEPELAEELNTFFSEIIMAPEFQDEALEILKKKKNRRLLKMVKLSQPQNQVRSVLGGILVQEPDLLPTQKWETVAGHCDQQTEKELMFAWLVVKHVKSNAIVIAKENTTLGVGAGQPNRVGAAKIALEQAGEAARGAVMASDAFFPFPDAVELAARAGIKAIVQPGGSIRDQEVVEAAKKLGITMVFTGARHFKH